MEQIRICNLICPDILPFYRVSPVKMSAWSGLIRFVRMWHRFPNKLFMLKQFMSKMKNYQTGLCDRQSKFRNSIRDYGCCFYFNQRFRLDKSGNLNSGHGREIGSDQFTIDGADIA